MTCTTCCAIKCEALQEVHIFTSFISASHNSISFHALTSWATICQGSVFLLIQHSNLACTKYWPTWPLDHHTWRISCDSYKPLPLVRRFTIFRDRTSSFCCLPTVSSLEPSKKLKCKFIASSPRKSSQTAATDTWLAIH